MHGQLSLPNLVDLAASDIADEEKEEELLRPLRLIAQHLHHHLCFYYTTAAFIDDPTKRSTVMKRIHFTSLKYPNTA